MPGPFCHLLLMGFSWGQKWHVSWGRVRWDDFLGLQTMFPLVLWWTIGDDNEKWQREGTWCTLHLLEWLKNWLVEYGVFEATRKMRLWEQRTGQESQKWPPCMKCTFLNGIKNIPSTLYPNFIPLSPWKTKLGRDGRVPRRLCSAGIWHGFWPRIDPGQTLLREMGSTGRVWGQVVPLSLPGFSPKLGF